MLYNKNLNCGAAASSEPHRNVFADLHKKKKAVFTCENCFFLTQKRYASGLLIDRSGSTSDFCSKGLQKITTCMKLYFLILYNIS
jgi:hypothetical protein